MENRLEILNRAIETDDPIKYLKERLEDNIYCAVVYEVNLHWLDEYDFSEFLTEGRSLYNIIDAIEEKYDNDFYKEHHIYMFDNLSIDEIYDYFQDRYNIHYQEYIDWVVRHDDGPYAKTRKRIKDCS